MTNILYFPDRRQRGASLGSQPVDPAVRAQVERAAQAALDTADRLIAILDRWDGDPDLEDGSDDEPSLGAPEDQASQIVWLRGAAADLELSLCPEEPTL
jgi:hypothetical protein